MIWQYLVSVANGKLAVLPPDNEVVFARHNRSVDNGDVVVKDAHSAPRVAGNPHQKRSGAVFDQELVKIDALQAGVRGGVGEPAVHADTIRVLINVSKHIQLPLLGGLGIL